MAPSLTVFFDLETTGCPDGAAIVSPYHRIVQLSAVLGAPAKADDAFNAVVNPGVHVPRASAAIHGLDDALVAAAPPFAAVWAAFERWIDAALAAVGVADPERATVRLVAHNMFGFDAVVLARALARAGLPPLAARRYRLADTLPPLRATTAHLDPLTRPNSLEAWHARALGEPFPNAHNALADVRALRRVVARSGLVPAESPPDVPDDAPLTALRYVRATRALRLFDALRAAGVAEPRSVGGLRRFAAKRRRGGGGAAPQTPGWRLEKLLRDHVAVFDDGQCEAIVAQVLRTPPGARAPLRYPYLQWPYVRVGAAARRGMERRGWTTRGRLRDHYLYACAEDADRFADELAAATGMDRAAAARPHWRT